MMIRSEDYYCFWNFHASINRSCDSTRINISGMRNDSPERFYLPVLCQYKFFQLISESYRIACIELSCNCRTILRKS